MKINKDLIVEISREDYDSLVERFDWRKIEKAKRDGYWEIDEMCPLCPKYHVDDCSDDCPFYNDKLGVKTEYCLAWVVRVGEELNLMTPVEIGNQIGIKANTKNKAISILQEFIYKVKRYLKIKD